MNGTIANLSSIKPEVIWIPYSILIVLLVAVVAFSFVRYHRRKIAKRKWAKEYAEENLQIQRARIHGITCNSNELRLVDLGSSMMHSNIFRLCSDLSIQSLPNFARHNMELNSSKGTDESVDVNKIVIEDWIEQNKLKHLSAKIQKDSLAGFRKDVSVGYQNQSSVSLHNDFSLSFQNDSSGGLHKDSSGGFHENFPAGFHKDFSTSFHKKFGFEHDLVEIELDEVCKSCKTTVLKYKQGKRLQLKTPSEALDVHGPYQYENATHQETQANSFVPIVKKDPKTRHQCLRTCRCCDTIVNSVQEKPMMEFHNEQDGIVGNERLGEYQDSLMRPKIHGNYDNIAFPPADIYAIPKKKQWPHKSDDKRYVKPSESTYYVPRNAAVTITSPDDTDRLQIKPDATSNRKTLQKRKRLYSRKSISKRRHEITLSMSQAKRTFHSNVSAYNKRPWSQIRIATDYSSTTSSERQADDECNPYEDVWSGRDEIGQASDQYSNIDNDTFKNQLASTTHNPVPDGKVFHKSNFPGTDFHISQAETDVFKETMNVDSISDLSVNVKMKLPSELQRNSSSENSVTYEKWLSRDTSQINSNLIEMAKLPAKSKLESNRDIQRKMKVDDKSKDRPCIGSIAQPCHHQLIKCTPLHNPCDQYFNCTDAEKIEKVAPKNSENPPGDIYWLDIHSEDTIV